MFFCEHKTPELVWLPEYQAQANGVTGLAGLVVVDAGGELSDLLGRALGEASAAIERLSPTAATARFSNDPILAVAAPYVAAVRLRVRDRGATAGFLDDSGVPVRKTADDALQVSSREGMGAVLEFV